jgi:8-oxo-dGTP pyrophosphatase MutT (NUDIX family)
VNSRDEISAGGVVYRRTAAGIDVLICKDAGYHRWVLPKGLVNKGEDYQQTAVREVREEVGVEARVVASLGEPEQYVYMRGGTRIFKKVYYFLMEYVAGDEQTHDHEMEEVRWAAIDEAIDLVAYKGAKTVLTRSKEFLEG